MATRQPFSVGTSQVGGNDGLAQANQVDLTGIASTIHIGAFGGGANHLVGIASTAAFGTIGGSKNTNAFTVGTSQVGGTDAVGLSDTQTRTLTGIAPTVAFGLLGGGTFRLTAIASTVRFGTLTPIAGAGGTFGFGVYGEAIFGDATIPLPPPTIGAPFIVGQSAVGDTDEVGGTVLATAQSAQLAPIESTVAFGTLGGGVVGLHAIASTLHFGELAVSSNPASVQIHAIASTLVFGALGNQLRLALTGVASTVAFGKLEAAPQLIGIASTARFGVLGLTPGRTSVGLVGIASTVQFGTFTVRLIAGFVVTAGRIFGHWSASISPNARTGTLDGRWSAGKITTSGPVGELADAWAGSIA